MKLVEALKTRWIVWVWNHTPNCAEMSRLASRSLDEPPSLQARLKMWLHYRICIWCERYSKQMRFLHRAASQFAGHPETDSQRALPAEAKERIVRRLHAARIIE